MRRACAVAAAVVLAGCGGGDRPRLERADGAPLAALADRVELRAATGDCDVRTAMARLEAAALRLVRLHRVPAELQEPFVSGVNDLTTRRVRCGRRVVELADVSVRVGDEVEPVPHSGDTAQQARNLAAWLRAYSD